MKISHKFLLVKNKQGVYISPEYAFVTPVDLSDGVWITSGEHRLADPPEIKVIQQQLSSKTKFGTIEKLIQQILSNLDKIHFAEVSLPKMTKAGAVAIESMMFSIGLSDNRWNIVGIGINKPSLECIEESDLYARIVNVSAGIIQPLLGENLLMGTIKDYIIFKTDKNEVFICAKGQPNV